MAEHGEYLNPVDAEPITSKANKIARTWIVMGAIGLVVAFGFAMVTDGGWKQLKFAYLASFAFVLSIGLGGLAFLVLTHLFRAGWSVVVRRPAEAIANTMPVLLILFLPIAGFVASQQGELFPWAVPASHWSETDSHGETAYAKSDHAEETANTNVITVATQIAEAGHLAAVNETVQAEGHGEGHYLNPKMMQAKRPYLNPTFFIIRWAVFFGLWILAARFYWRNSRLQDENGDHTLTNRMEGWSPINTLMFALTVTFASIDILMSLEPLWFSTIIGVYYFAGAFMSAVALMIVMIMMLHRMGTLVSVNKEHMHDLGKLLFAFVFFWGYIAFSQYMLIWYGNLPEETVWYELHGATTVPAQMTGWTVVFFVLVACKLLIPFAGLLSRHVKRNMALLTFWAVWLLVMNYVDMWWFVMPVYDPHHVTIGLIEIGTALGMFALMVGVAMKNFGKAAPVPVKDPRLNDSLGFHNI